MKLLEEEEDKKDPKDFFNEEGSVKEERVNYCRFPHKFIQIFSL